MLSDRFHGIVAPVLGRMGNMAPMLLQDSQYLLLVVKDFAMHKGVQPGNSPYWNIVTGHALEVAVCHI